MDELTRLALAAGDGDRAALQSFVRASQADVWRFCAHLTSPAEADDLAQDTFVRAVHSLPRFRGDASARTWLLTIARRSCADHIRGTVRRRRLQERIEHEAAASGPARVPPSTATELDDLVGSLHPDRREAFVLTQVVGLSYDDAAEVCGCPIGTIRSRVARARADLLDALEDGDDRVAAPERRRSSG